jgi:hypothetical protein
VVKKFKWPYTEVVMRNVRRNTFTYYHELRHLNQERRFSLISWSAVFEPLLAASALIFLVNNYFDAAKLLLGAWFLLWIIPEVDAQYFAYRKTRDLLALAGFRR